MKYFICYKFVGKTQKVLKLVASFCLANNTSVNSNICIGIATRPLGHVFVLSLFKAYRVAALAGGAVGTSSAMVAQRLHEK